MSFYRGFLQSLFRELFFKYVTVDSFEIVENVKNIEIYKGEKRDKELMKSIK
jgi:hypothetical protein